MATFTAWCDDLEAALAEPFPADVVQVKDEGKRGKYDFVSWHHYARRLNHLVGGGWEAKDPAWGVVGGKLVMGVPVTILGVTRTNFGDEDEEAEVNEAGNSKMFGTPVTNAWAQAFKRSCALFGMGLEFYDKRRRRARSETQQSSAPAEPRATGPAPKATNNQISRIRRNLLESDAFSPEEHKRIDALLKHEPTKAWASRLIDAMKERMATGEGAMPLNGNGVNGHAPAPVAR